MAYTIWGKCELDALKIIKRSHPLTLHSLDVAAVFEALLADDNIRRSLARAGGREDLSRVQCARLAVMAFWHDLGKVNVGFQASVLEDEPGKPARASHIEEVFALFEDPLKESFAEILEIDRLSEWFLPYSDKQDGEHAALDMLYAALSHHGRPACPWQTTVAERKRMNGLFQPWTSRQGITIDPMEGLKEMADTLRVFLPEAFITINDDSAAIPATPRLQNHFAGLIMLADWFGSSRDHFPYAEGDDAEDVSKRAIFARQAAKRLLDETGITVNPAKGLPSHRFHPQKVIGGYQPNAMQKAVSTLPLNPGGSIGLIESETGSGKTEAAMIHFLRLYAMGEVSGLFYALPTRSSAVQIHGRIVTALETIFGMAAPPAVLAVPGYFRVDDQEGRRNENGTLEWQHDLGARAWATENPKRYLAAPIVVGTIDQGLMSVLRAKHALMRHALLRRMLIVIDEVHASDAYMTDLSCQMIDRHAKQGGHSLLLSATCGSAGRSRYFNEPLPSFNAARAEIYPLISYCPTDGKTYHARQAVKVDQPGRRRKIKIIQKNIMLSPQKVAAEAIRHAAKGAKVLVIRNTVNAAVETQEKLEELLDPKAKKAKGKKTTPKAKIHLFQANGKVSLHHSRFAAEDRVLLDQAVESSFGKDSPISLKVGEGRILIATQTMEQSIDIDADVLLADICPMDVLLQRLGRLQRHDRDRPAGYKSPKAIVLTPASRKLELFIDRPHHGLGIDQAYCDLRIIEATWRLIERNPVFDIPFMNRMLVEAATHPDQLDAIVKQLEGQWAQHQAEVDGQSIEARGLAGAALLSLSYGYGDERIIQGEVSEKISTRLGANDTLARFKRPFIGPFGTKIRAIRVPGWMVKIDEGDTVIPQIIDQTDDYVAFQYGHRYEKDEETKKWDIKPAYLLYDHHGLQPISREDLTALRVAHQAQTTPPDSTPPRGKAGNTGTRAPKKPARKASLKKTAAQKAVAKKTTAKKAAAKKAGAEKPTAKQTARKKATGRKAVTMKASTKRAPSKKAPAKKTSVRKASTKRTTARKPGAKKTGAKTPRIKNTRVRKTAAKQAAPKSARKKAPARKTAPKKTPSKRAPSKNPGRSRLARVARKPRH